MAENKTYEEVLEGVYTVKFEKCYNTISKSGKPMLTAWFRIKEGNFAGRLLFMHQIRTNEVGNKVAAQFEEKAAEYGIGKDGKTFELVYKRRASADGNRVYDQFFIND